jgi:hypothetical protein
MIWLLLACEAVEPEVVPVQETPKPRVSLHSVASGSQTMAEAPAPVEVVKVTPKTDSKCQVDIDMRHVSHDRNFKEDGVEGRWDRIESAPLVMKDPSRGCPILVPAKLIIEVPAELGCIEAEIELNVGCGEGCSYAKSIKDGKAIQEWTNSVNKHEDLILAGPMDSIELWGEGMEICRIQLR